MAFNVIPLIPSNQNFTCTLPIDSKNVTLGFTIRYNEPGGYWFMSIMDKSGSVLIDGIPLVTGQYPAANLLEQYEYLGIGSAAIIPTSSQANGIPRLDSLLGTDYVLVWGDTVVS